MREHPIIFSASMVRAILEGRKTQTRRVLKIRGVDGGQYPITSPAEEMLRFDDGTFHYLSTGALSGPYSCPYGQPGDQLWLRESFSGPHEWETIPPSGWGWDRSDVPIWYWADGNPEHGDWTRPRPSIHMPRWASRITLEITDVRVQRLQDITDDDAAAEGCPTVVEPDGSVTCGRHKTVFRELWDLINESRDFGWNANPWVWVIAFKRVEE